MSGFANRLVQPAIATAMIIKMKTFSLRTCLGVCAALAVLTGLNAWSGVILRSESRSISLIGSVDGVDFSQEATSLGLFEPFNASANKPVSGGGYVGVEQESTISPTRFTLSSSATGIAGYPPQVNAHANSTFEVEFELTEPCDSLLTFGSGWDGSGFDGTIALSLDNLVTGRVFSYGIAHYPGIAHAATLPAGIYVLSVGLDGGGGTSKYDTLFGGGALWMNFDVVSCSAGGEATSLLCLIGLALLGAMKRQSGNARQRQ